MKHSVIMLASFFLLVSYASAASINVYTSRHYPEDKKIFKQFEKQTGHKLNIVFVKNASQLIERLKTQKDKAAADIVMTVDVGNLWRAQEAGLFRPLGGQKIKRVVPKNLRSDQDLWTALSVRARIVAVDTSKLPAGRIKTYEDLGGQDFKKKLLVRSSGHVYNQSLVASLIAHNGAKKAESWVQSLTKNLARKPQGGDRDQLRAMARGEGAVSIINSYYAGKMWNSKKESDRQVMKNIALVFPNQSGRGAHINISGAGIGVNSQNPKVAREFLEFLLSRPIQKRFAEGNFEFPARSDVRIEGIMASYQKKKFDTESLSNIGRFTPEAVKLMDRSAWR